MRNSYWHKRHGKKLKRRKHIRQQHILMSGLKKPTAVQNYQAREKEMVRRRSLPKPSFFNRLGWIILLQKIRLWFRKLFTWHMNIIKR